MSVNPDPHAQQSTLRPLFFVLLGGAVILLVAILGWIGQRDAMDTADEPSPVAASGVPAVPGTGTAGQQTAGVILPSFDVARIGPEGNAVMAGRAAPNADITIRNGEQILGTVRADARGEWVFVPSEPLPPGGLQLSLSARNSDGQVLESVGSVVLVVPAHGQDIAGRPATSVAQQAPLALVVPENDASAAVPRVIQAPAVETGAGISAGTVRLDVVDYGAAGQVRFSGAASPNSTVRLYVDDAPVGEATADAAGRWALSPAASIVAGTHRLRVDQLDAQGRVSARVELPFLREATDKLALQDGRVVVQPGQSLWLIARATYGDGVRYTVIYQANRTQIRDPDLIYPGQIFDLPRQ